MTIAAAAIYAGGTGAVKVCSALLRGGRAVYFGSPPKRHKPEDIVEKIRVFPISP
jgi:hypothetical protein